MHPGLHPANRHVDDEIQDEEQEPDRRGQPQRTKRFFLATRVQMRRPEGLRPLVAALGVIELVCHGAKVYTRPRASRVPNSASRIAARAMSISLRTIARGGASLTTWPAVGVQLIITPREIVSATNRWANSVE